MKAKDYLKKQMDRMWGLQNSVLESVTDDVLMKLPPGTISPIGVIWLHMIHSQDYFTALLSGKQSVWQAEAWHTKFGVDSAPGMGEDWSKYQDLDISTQLLQDYSQAVRDFTQQVLDATDDSTLDETVKIFTDSDPKAEVWALLVAHNLHHCGEIAALKGVFGGKGLPF